MVREGETPWEGVSHLAHAARKRVTMADVGDHLQRVQTSQLFYQEDKILYYLHRAPALAV